MRLDTPVTTRAMVADRGSQRRSKAIPQVARGEPLGAAQDLGPGVARLGQQLEERGHGDHEGGGHRQGGDPAGQGAQALAEQHVDREAGQGQHREQPDQAGRAGSVQGSVTP
jgi:hypothetical protein